MLRVSANMPSPQIRLPYRIKSKAAISLTFNLHCKSNSCFVIYSVLSSYLMTSPCKHNKAWADDDLSITCSEKTLFTIYTFFINMVLFRVLINKLSNIEAKYFNMFNIYSALTLKYQFKYVHNCHYLGEPCAKD